MIKKLAGQGIVESATLLLTRVLAWAATLFAGVTVAATASGDKPVAQPTPAQGVPPAPAEAANFLGFNQGQSAALLIALFGLIAIVAAADLLGRSWVHATRSSFMLETAWPCTRDIKPDVPGTLLALRPADKKALFVADGGSEAKWVPFEEIKGRGP